MSEEEAARIEEDKKRFEEDKTELISRLASLQREKDQQKVLIIL